MKYTNEITIDLPLNQVLEFFDSPKNLPKWQPELISLEPISGTPGQPGAKSRLKYLLGKREMEMIETITVRNLPDEFSATYETKGVYNLASNQFVAISENQTMWLTQNDFRFSGFMWFMSFFMGKKAFQKQSQYYMDKFKEFAESQATTV